MNENLMHLFFKTQKQNFHLSKWKKNSKSFWQCSTKNSYPFFNSWLNSHDFIATSYSQLVDKVDMQDQLTSFIFMLNHFQIPSHFSIRFKYIRTLSISCLKLVELETLFKNDAIFLKTKIISVLPPFFQFLYWLNNQSPISVACNSNHFETR